MDHALTILRDYTDRVQAETVRIRLAAAGIRALVTGEDAATALGMGGAVTRRMVRVEVPVADFDRAVEILQEDERLLAEAGPWICSRCREQNEAAFEVCWSCSKPRSDDDERGRLDGTDDSHPAESLSPSISVEEPHGPITPDDNPYRPVLIQQTPGLKRKQVVASVGDVTRDDVRRCLRAAVMGTFLLPPLISLYSIWLLMSLDADAYRAPETGRRVIIAWCINLAAIPAWLVLYREIY